MMKNMALLIHEFQTPKHKAITISRRVPISPSVVDAQIVQATSEAAHWYGFAQPEFLIGRWQSYIQHPEDIQLSRAMAVRRHLGYEGTPTDYVLRIRQGYAHRFRAVMKHTTQLEFEGETYWITELEEPRAPLLTETFDLSRFPLQDIDLMQQFSGVMSVADMEARLHKTPVGRVIHPSGLHMEEIQPATLDATQPSSTRLEYPPWREAWAQLVLAPGDSVILDDGIFLHRCGHCRVAWLSERPNPARCPRLRADTRGPKCGTRRWRQRRAEEVAVTSARVEE